MTQRRPSPHYTPLQGEAKAPPAPPPVPSFLPGDILPKTATLDPRFNPTQPIFASAQDPELAREYGILRNGTHMRMDGSPQPPPAAAPPPPAAPPSASPPAPPAPVAAPPAPSIVEKAPAPAKPAETYSEDPPLPGAVDLVSLRESVTEGVMNSQEQRALVESRLKGGFDYADFLLDRPIQQTVVIIPDRFEITFQAIPAHVELRLKQLISEEARSAIFDDYLLDKYNLMGVTAAVHAIAGTVLPTYLDDAGRFSPDRFEARMQWLMRRPMPLLVLLSVHYIWFSNRMHKALLAIDPKAG